MRLLTTFKLNTFIYSGGYGRNSKISLKKKKVVYDGGVYDGGVSEDAFSDVSVKINISCFYISMHCQKQS